MEWVYLTAIIVAVVLVGAGLVLRGQKKKLKSAPRPRGYVQPSSSPTRPATTTKTVERAKVVRETTRSAQASTTGRALSAEDRLREDFAGRVGRDAADRLIDLVIRRNPGKSELWCIEKAIWDYERGLS